MGQSVATLGDFEVFRSYGRDILFFQDKRVATCYADTYEATHGGLVKWINKIHMRSVNRSVKIGKTIEKLTAEREKLRLLSLGCHAAREEAGS